MVNKSNTTVYLPVKFFPGTCKTNLYGRKCEKNDHVNVIIPSDNEMEDELDISYTTCHICDIDVPTPFLNQHFDSAKHKINLKIANTALERIRMSININISTVNSSSSLHYCPVCVIVIEKEKKKSHEQTILHRNAVTIEKFLNDFYLLYTNDNKIDSNEDNEQDSECDNETINIGNESLNETVLNNSSTNRGSLRNDEIEETIDTDFNDKLGNSNKKKHKKRVNNRIKLKKNKSVLIIKQDNGNNKEDNVKDIIEVTDSDINTNLDSSTEEMQKIGNSNNKSIRKSGNYVIIEGSNKQNNDKNEVNDVKGTNLLQNCNIEKIDNLIAGLNIRTDFYDKLDASNENSKITLCEKSDNCSITDEISIKNGENHTNLKDYDVIANNIAKNSVENHKKESIFLDDRFRHHLKKLNYFFYCKICKITVHPEDDHLNHVSHIINYNIFLKENSMTKHSNMFVFCNMCDSWFTCQLELDHCNKITHLIKLKQKR